MSEPIDFDDPEDLHAILAKLTYLEGDREKILQDEYLYDNWSIDKELSDEYSLVAFNDNKKELIHAVRGTKLKDVDDLKTDAQIFTKGLLKFGIPFGAVGSFLQRLILKRDIRKEIPYMFIEEGQQPARLSSAVLDLMEQGQFEDLDLPVAFYNTAFSKSLVRRSLLGLSTGTIATILGSYVEAEGERLNREYNKHEKIKQKYADYSRSLTGHSLGGGISLHMSRTLNIPTYSFNPSPTFSLFTNAKPHPKSRIIKTQFELLRPFSPPEVEKTKIVKSKYINTHTIDNFVPPKTPKRVIRQQSKIAETKFRTVPKIERQKAFVEKPTKKCDENPELPECKSFDFYV
jgi:hypothetical protein